MKNFKFDKNDVTRYIQYELRALKKMEEPLNFIIDALKKKKHYLKLSSLNKIDLNKIKFNEEKNYDWCVIEHKNVTLLIRKYQQHFTIYTKVTGDRKDIFGDTRSKYGAFTFYSNTEDMEDPDEYWENPFLDLNAHMKTILEQIIERGVHWLTNSVCLPIPKHCEVKLAFESESMYSIDLLIFCLEEIDTLYNTIFAETKMLERLKEMSDWVGKPFYSIGSGEFTIAEIRTEVKDDYYHGVGISLVNEKGKTEFNDVYCLTRYYFDRIFETKSEEEL